MALMSNREGKIKRAMSHIEGYGNNMLHNLLEKRDRQTKPQRAHSRWATPMKV
jgi:hypothetical protein